MLDKIEKKYAHALAGTGDEASATLLTLQDEAGRKIKLKRSALTEEEESLLNTLFGGSAGHRAAPVTESDQCWTDLLLNGELPDHKSLSLPVRFIHFSLKGELSDHEGFTVAVNSLFSSAEALVWSNSSDGVLVQRLDENFEDDQPDQRTLDALTGDFYVQLSFFSGSPQSESGMLKQQFEQEQRMFKAARTYSPSQHVYHEKEVLSHWLLNSLDNETESILKEQLEAVRNDHDLLYSVRVYLECNMNTSMAAKKMFVHRNTLQYRVDKFIDKTALDIKQFPNAVAAYLTILALHSKKKA
ncbi:hypothetical protein CR205_09960 [Alteribacter lacisalsi]|uniref:PucR C-terminal helix-turn-helix domain-containing protein n=1 Tax=Alteribacter lacisalsi TaxID=2045244 RepID=A0A2W0HDC3_9BACI|nr:helix-turn-helix domain-containing protein [Alteribacter lacisalsi]PYZ98871.1 hypothetical protein CR205_09960 [Alteribacter lacisalsi]